MFKVTMTMAMFVFMASQSVFAANVGSTCKQSGTKRFPNQEKKADIKITGVETVKSYSDSGSFVWSYKKIYYTEGENAGFFTDGYVFRTRDYITQANSQECDKSANYMVGTGDAGITSCLSCSDPQ